jgi:hypothetical protein
MRASLEPDSLFSNALPAVARLSRIEETDEEVIVFLWLGEI